MRNLYLIIYTNYVLQRVILFYCSKSNSSTSSIAKLISSDCRDENPFEVFHEDDLYKTKQHVSEKNVMRSISNDDDEMDVRLAIIKIINEFFFF